MMCVLTGAAQVPSGPITLFLILIGLNVLLPSPQMLDTTKKERGRDKGVDF